LDHPDARETIDARPDARATIDAHVNPPIDARPDARPPIDAFVPPPDASNPPFCAINSHCVVPDTCCFLFQCIEGTGLGDEICLPN